jgi:hypothetical protein
MVQVDNFKWQELIEYTGIVNRKMVSLTDHGNRVIEGRSKGIKSVRDSRKWLLESISATELEPLVKSKLSLWGGGLTSDLIKFVASKLEDVLTSCPVNGLNSATILDLSKNVRETLDVDSKNDLAKQKNAISLGLDYFRFANSAVDMFVSDSLIKKVKSEGGDKIGEGSQFDLSSKVPSDTLTKYKQIEMLAYLLGYAGAMLIFYGSPVCAYIQKKWCIICFRRAIPSSKYCSVHDSLNKNKREFRLGQKVRIAMIKDIPSLKNWHMHKQQIKQCDRWDEDSNHWCDAEAESDNWKESLITRIKNNKDKDSKNSILSRKLSFSKSDDKSDDQPKPVDWEREIRSKSDWGEIASYIRLRFGNNSERSIRIESIFSWLSMAEDWYKVEFIFRPPDSSSIKKVAKGSYLPMDKLIFDLCVQEPGINKEQIGERLKKTPQAISQYTKRYPELEAFFKPR